MKLTINNITDLSSITDRVILNFETYSFDNFLKYKVDGVQTVSVFLEIDGSIKEVIVSDCNITPNYLVTIYENIFVKVYFNYSDEIKLILDFFQKQSDGYNVTNVSHGYHAQVVLKNYLSKISSDFVYTLAEPLDAIVCARAFERKIYRELRENSIGKFIFVYKWSVFEVRI